MSNSEDDIPTFELTPEHDHDEQPEPMSEEELEEAYLRLKFENYDDETLREAMGAERFREAREQYESLSKAQDTFDYEEVDDCLEEADERLDEEELLERVREARGEEFVQEHQGAILADAERMGMI